MNYELLPFIIVISIYNTSIAKRLFLDDRYYLNNIISLPWPIRMSFLMDWICLYEFVLEVMSVNLYTRYISTLNSYLDTTTFKEEV